MGRAMLACLLLSCTASARAEVSRLDANVAYRHGIAFLSELKYPPDFSHFAYARPDAPKGGSLRLAAPGTYDSFNGIAQKGRPARGLEFLGLLGQYMLLYDRLLEPAADEETSAYGRLAEGVARAPDGSSVTFLLREGAYFHDGKPITVDDVVFSFEAFKEHGSAILRTTLRDVVRAERAGPREVRYVLAPAGARNPNIPLTLGTLAVLPKHYWQGKDISRSTVEPPLGSGPYRIADYQLGRYVVYERVKDYWGRDLPVNAGRYNFDTVKWDYFRDDHAQLEAHKAHVIDMRPETVAKAWATEYEFPAVRAGVFKKELVPLTRPAGMYWPLFWNLRVERFQDIRVREALWLLYDFKWINRVLLYDFYDYSTSVFYNSEMAHEGLPSARELALLEPLRDHLPARVFSEPYRPPESTGYGRNRAHLVRALELFRQAGWQVRDGRMLHGKTGEPFRIDFVVATPSLQRTLLPYVDALKRIGIETTIRVPETSNWQYRMRTGAFDAGMMLYLPSHRPGLELIGRFSSMSAGVPFSLNWASIRNPAIDKLITHVIGARTREDLLAATRAFDRALLWNFYVVPGMAMPNYRSAYWDKFGRVEGEDLSRSVALDAWWWDADKAARVERWLTRSSGDGG